jgi:hypothetical protein
MDMSPNSQPKFVVTGGRRVDRQRYEAQIQFRKGTRRALVKLCDISRFGARIEGVFLVREGDHLFVTLPGIAPVGARVAWVSQFEFGCEFIQPLNDIILNAIIARS